MMMKLTKVKISLLYEADQILFIEQGIRGDLQLRVPVHTFNMRFSLGGMSYINQRYCQSGEQTYQHTGQTFHGSILYIDGERNNLTWGGGGSASCRPNRSVFT